MAGKPGRSGSGGARPGAGRPKLDFSGAGTVVSDGLKRTPREFLIDVMNDPQQDMRLRLEAAKTAIQYMEAKPGVGTKKGDQQEKAKEAGNGKFKPSAPPKLQVVAS